MSIHFHSLTISNIRKETSDCISLAFEVPLHLKETFSYRAGQNLTIRKLLAEGELRRSYSICSAPADNELRIAIKAVTHGRFSTFANNHLQIGDILEVLPPTGKFYTELLPSVKKKYLAFAAGSGITPIHAIIRSTLSTEPQSEFTLVYGNQKRDTIIFRESLEALKNRFISRFRVVHVLSRESTDAPINNGRIDAEKCAQLSGALVNWKQVDEYFICGPQQMIITVRAFLLSVGVAPGKIHVELFTVPGDGGATADFIPVQNLERSAVAKINLKIDGVGFSFDLPFNGLSILDAALAAGADLPYACKGGVCSTCRAKLVQGEVQMRQNYALEPEELAAGFVLACQSRPVTQAVALDFDTKN
jgi:ring-1,2-phenylacetyl-CoA epoxidase subunit PaaE